MRKSTLYLAGILVSSTGLLLLLFIHPAVTAKSDRERIRNEAELVRQLGLTDLCLFTEARYTRHLTQADLHSAFQDHPMALDHFPSGAMVRPPLEIWRRK